jgi:hypothetical protein
MSAEPAAQPLPSFIIGRENERTGRVNIETMDDAGTQTALANPKNLGPKCQHRIQDRLLLIRSKRMHAPSRGLVDDDPARTFPGDFDRSVCAGNREFVLGADCTRDGESLANRDRMRLIPKLQGTIAELHAADFEQMTHSGP